VADVYRPLAEGRFPVLLQRTPYNRADPGTGVWLASHGYVKPTDFKDDEVLFRAYSPGGTSLVPDSDIVSATLATTAVTTGGIGEMSAVQLQKELAGKAAGVNPYIGDLEEGLAGGASPKDIETMFQLVHLYFTSPRRDSTAFASFRTRLLAAMENQSADPRSAFSDTLQVTLAQHNPRAKPMDIGRIRSWDLDQSIAFYRNRFADASDFTFALVGNFETAEVKPLVERWLASLPATDRKETWKDTGVRPPKGIVVKEVRKGIEPKSETRIIFTGPFEYTQESRYTLASLVAVLDIKLRDILREDMGGTYGVSVSQSSAKAPWERYTVSIGFGSAPDRLAELTRAVFAEIERIQKEGVDAETVAKVKEMQRRTHETSLKQNGYWISQIIYGAQTGEDPAAFLSYPSVIDGLTAARLQEAARAYLRPDNYVRVSLVPQNNN
jgi:zinc protease